tara:strand:+ start:414 stop:977 length:564 start_codon:yes stop_codon:yes gene_type:complete
MLIGILAFQGDFYLHKKTLDKMNVESIFVYDKKTLNKTDALIIPGGESTVMNNFLTKTKLNKTIKEYSTNHNVFGTCAGAIIMSTLCDDEKIDCLKLINVKSFRNSWGRQVHSFDSDLELTFCNEKINAKFIRAPKIKLLSKNNNILASYKKNPVLVRNDKHLISTFHPELTSTILIHEYFINMINE